AEAADVLRDVHGDVDAFVALAADVDERCLHPGHAELTRGARGPAGEQVAEAFVRPEELGVVAVVEHAGTEGRDLALDLDVEVIDRDVEAGSVADRRREDDARRLGGRRLRRQRAFGTLRKATAADDRGLDTAAGLVGKDAGQADFGNAGEAVGANAIVDRGVALQLNAWIDLALRQRADLVRQVQL